MNNERLNKFMNNVSKYAKYGIRSSGVFFVETYLEKRIESLTEEEFEKVLSAMALAFEKMNLSSSEILRITNVFIALVRRDNDERNRK